MAFFLFLGDEESFFEEIIQKSTENTATPEAGLQLLGFRAGWRRGQGRETAAEADVRTEGAGALLPPPGQRRRRGLRLSQASGIPRFPAHERKQKSIHFLSLSSFFLSFLLLLQSK